MLLDLREIFVSDGAAKDVSYPLDLHDVEIAGEHPFCSPVEIKAHVENRSGIVTVDIEASFDYALSLLSPPDRGAGGGV